MNVSPSTAFTVSEVPSSATEPLTAMNFARSFGAGSEMRHAVEIAPGKDFGHPVDMAADHMAAKFVADFQRPLEVDTAPPAIRRAS